jgi:hypothetical protein
MGGSADVIQYGIPIVYDVSRLLDYLSSSFHSTLTHGADGRCVVSEFQPAPVAAGHATHASERKSVASPPCPSATMFCCFVTVVLIRILSATLLRRTLPGDRLTVCSRSRASVMQ